MRKILFYIKGTIAGFFSGMADAQIEDKDNYRSAQQIARWAKPFLVDGFVTIAYYLVMAKSEYALKNWDSAKSNYDFAMGEIAKHPEIAEFEEFVDTLAKFKDIYD